MSFGGGGWSDDEAPAAAAPRRAARRPVPLQRRAGVRRKREEDDAMDEDGPPAAAAAAAPAPGSASPTRPAGSSGRCAAGTQPKCPPTPLRRPDWGGSIPWPTPTSAPRPCARPGWLSGDCRCLQCELTRTAQLLSKKQEPRVCVLWDLDNYGFPEAVKRDAPAAAEQLPPQLVVWAFYGLGWTELRKTEPEKQITGRSLFGVLRRGKSLHITPCGNFPQAADEAMQRVVRIMRNVHIVVVSGDKPHLLRCRKAHAQQRRIPGQPRTEFGRINPAESGRDVDKVWQQIRAFCQAAQGGD
eukprot:TRINITY_DN18583_c0_g1_i4.p1 TRINITY_DN18583_c0_g1~~TRINITY_DN18583_c0_g1_i4.p1  ORF type:complete len:299 (+),score=81.88 TRINITY_DN18583_c0_g1_i4:83-979(+)